MSARVALVALAACQVGGDPWREPPAKRFEHDMMLRYHMHENFDLAHAIERLLVGGGLDEARGLARSIAESTVDPEIAGWTEQAALVRDRAAALAAAPSVDEGCRRAAALAAACAGCHAATQAEPELRSPPQLPPDGTTTAARMVRHRWAADRMWEGLIASDDAAWQAGLGVMSAAPQPRLGLDERAGFARRLQSLAVAAQAARNLDERAQIYGEILVTCAGCHTMPR